MTETNITLSIDNGTDLAPVVMEFFNAVGVLTQEHIGYLGNDPAPESGMEGTVGEPLQGGEDFLSSPVSKTGRVRFCRFLFDQSCFFNFDFPCDCFGNSDIWRDYFSSLCFGHFYFDIQSYFDDVCNKDSTKIRRAWE